MKKIVFIIAVLATVMTGCYDEFRLDYEFTGVAFSAADGGSNVAGVLHRSVVKDEGLKLDVGINLTGVLENKTERWADFVIDPTLLDDPAMVALGYKLMPTSFYSISGNRFEIHPDSYLGKVTITLDSAKFVSDPNAAKFIYAIPFRMTATSEDSINANLSTKIVVIKYINHYEGYYDQTGKADYFGMNGVAAGTTELKNVLAVNTIHIDTVYSDGMMNMTGVNYRMRMHVNSDNSVYIKELQNPETLVLSLYEGIYTEAYTYACYDKTGKQTKTKSETTASRIMLTVDENTLKIENKLRNYSKLLNYSYQVKVNADNSVDLLNFSCPDSVSFTLVANGENKYDPAAKKFTLNYKIQLGADAYETGSTVLTWKSKNRDKQFITPTGENKYDPETSTFTLNYRMTSFYGDYYNVSSKMVWRNRIRDGVNEWRR